MFDKGSSTGNGKQCDPLAFVCAQCGAHSRGWKPQCRQVPFFNLTQPMPAQNCVMVNLVGGFPTMRCQ